MDLIEFVSLFVGRGRFWWIMFVLVTSLVDVMLKEYARNVGMVRLKDRKDVWTVQPIAYNAQLQLFVLDVVLAWLWIWLLLYVAVSIKNIILLTRDASVMMDSGIFLAPAVFVPKD